MKIQRIFALFYAICFIAGISASAQPVPYPNGATDELEPFVHDPVMAVEDGKFYLFHTGPGINIWRSDDMEHWDTIGSVFNEVPQWMFETIPGFSGHLWAPDIYHYNGTWYLYYSVSAFGKNTSFIGVAASPTLNPDDPAYAWTDHGIIIQSFPGMDNWNAIDPNVIDDENGVPYLAFGSFWSGLQIVQLAENRIELANKEHPEIVCIASRNPSPEVMPEKGYPVGPGEGAIEGPFIIHRGAFFYLFASVDYCCRGSDSTYKMVVGRSMSVEGPYLDKEGISMVDGGGTILLTGGGRWYAVGHNGVTAVDGTVYLVYHAYDSENLHAWARLQIKPLVWEDDWPTVSKTSCCVK